jgi:hypothetical protein
MRQTAESKQFFFAKNYQKTLVYKALSLPRRARQMAKSFCFFFQKEVLSYCRCVSLKATWYEVPPLPSYPSATPPGRRKCPKRVASSCI